MNTVLNLRQFMSAVAVATLLACGAAAVAQTPAPARIRGTISKVAGDILEVELKGGKSATVRLAPEAGILGVSIAAVTDILPGSFIGSAAVGQPDGSLEALEVTLFPPGMKPGAGHYPWDLGNNSSMTNGTVGDVVVSNGRTITVKYPDGEKKITIPLDVPIVRLEKGDRSLLVPGAHAVFFMQKAADGTQVVRSASVGKGDVVPPM